MLRSHTTASSWIINYAKNARMCCLSKNKRGTFQQPRPSTLLHEAKQSRAGSVGGTAGTAVASNDRDLRFESHQQNFLSSFRRWRHRKDENKEKEWGGGAHCTENSVLALQPAAPNFILGVPKNFDLDVVEIYWRHCSEQLREAW